MINWNFELGSSTPPKQPFEQGSTGCFKGSQNIKSDKKDSRKGIRRSSKQLSSDSDQQIQKMQRSIKKFKFQNEIPPFMGQDDIIPFQTGQMTVQDQQQQQIEHMEADELLFRRPLVMGKKESACEMDLINKLPNIPPLYRMNSTLVGYTDRDMLEYLGDNVYINDIQKEQEDKKTKFTIPGSSRFEADYLFIQSLGKTFMFSGNVYKCLNKLDRMVYVIKQYHITHHSPQFSIVRSQMQVSNDDRSNCLAKFYLSWFENKSMFMVYEPATFTIASLNLQKQKLTEKQIRNLLVDACQSLEYLQTKQMNHLNIKPSNIINCRGRFKLMDMIISKQNLNLVESYQKKYMAPQMQYPILLNQQDLWKVDIYALGMVIIQNIIGKHFLKSKSIQRLTLKQNIQSMYQYSPSLIKILMRMTSADSKLRPSFKQIIGVQQLKPSSSIQRKLSL